jgi:hypothetical protein
MADIWLPSDGNVQVFIDKDGVLSVTERVDMAPRPVVSQLGTTGFMAPLPFPRPPDQPPE